MQSIPSRIRARRLELGLSQQEVAHRAGLSTKWVTRVERYGTKKLKNAETISIKLASLVAISAALGTTVAWLVEPVEIKPVREKPLGKFQRRIVELTPMLDTKEARLLASMAEYLIKKKDV